MKLSVTAAIAMLVLFLPWGAQALDSDTEIKAVLTKQADAWNKGDIPTFVTTYADDCIFVGKKILQGRVPLLARYQKTYPTPDAMGHLTFSNMAVHLLDRDNATVTADWHLDRTSAGGGPVGGYFSLVLHHQKSGWKIALDHTSKAE